MIAATISTFEIRSVDSADRMFLRRLYATTRAGEMALTGWRPQQVEAFLDMQFIARERYYGERFPSREDVLILVDGQPAGRFCVDRSTGEVRIIDIAVLPEHRRAGIGTALLTGVLREAASANLPAVLEVAGGNPAANLYRRIGFVTDSSDGVYEEMRWRPSPASSGPKQ